MIYLIKLLNQYMVIFLDLFKIKVSSPIFLIFFFFHYVGVVREQLKKIPSKFMKRQHIDVFTENSNVTSNEKIWEEERNDRLFNRKVFYSIKLIIPFDIKYVIFVEGYYNSKFCSLIKFNIYIQNIFLNIIFYCKIKKKKSEIRHFDSFNNSNIDNEIDDETK